jgi:hypothetical protein
MQLAVGFVMGWLLGRTVEELDEGPKAEEESHARGCATKSGFTTYVQMMGIDCGGNAAPHERPIGLTQIS